MSVGQYDDVVLVWNKGLTFSVKHYFNFLLIRNVRSLHIFLGSYVLNL